MTHHIRTANLTTDRVHTASPLTWLRGLIRASLNRRKTSRLLEFDDRQLADIGLQRQDVRTALRVPFWKDPSSQLSRLYQVRRRQK